MSVKHFSLYLSHGWHSKNGSVIIIPFSNLESYITPPRIPLCQKHQKVLKHSWLYASFYPSSQIPPPKPQMTGCGLRLICFIFIVCSSPKNALQRNLSQCQSFGSLFFLQPQDHIFFKFIYMFERQQKRERKHEWREGQIERIFEQTPSWSAESATGLILQPVRSWPEPKPKSQTQPTEPPGCPKIIFSNAFQ